MSSFTDKLHLVYYPKKNIWKTGRDFLYFVGEEYGKEKILVPKGFETDLASVPWPASMFIPKAGQYNQAAVLHDYLYSRLGVLEEKTYSRAECDMIFLEAMEVIGVPKWKRLIMYRAVRLGGWLPWRSHAYKNETKKEKK